MMNLKTLEKRRTILDFIQKFEKRLKNLTGF